MHKKTNIEAKAFSFLFVIELILSFNPASATIAQPLKKTYSEKVEHFVIFDEVDQLEVGMTYIHVQLPLNTTAIYHQSEIMEVNSRKFIHTIINLKIPQAFDNAIKTTAEFFLKRLNRKMDKFSNANKNLPNGKIISKCSTTTPLHQSSPIEEEHDLMINDGFKLELFNTYLFNLRGEINST